ATAAYLSSHPATRYAIGGPAAAADPTATAIAGVDRYATAAAVQQRFFPAAARVAVASGRSFADGLAAGAAAGHFGPPLLLVPADVGLPQTVLDALSGLHGVAVV